MASIDSVMQRALRAETPGIVSADFPGFLERHRPGLIREQAADFLFDIGVEPVGKPSLVDFAIRVVTPYVEEGLKDWHASLAAPQRGRPQMSFHEALVFAAALHLHWRADLKWTGAAREAAKFLGAPATKSRVEKGEKRFRQMMAGISRIAEQTGFDRAQVADAAAFLLLHMQGVLASLRKAEIDERRLGHQRRFSSRHASFIGATPR